MRALLLSSLLFAATVQANPDLQHTLDSGDVKALKGLLAAGLDPNTPVGPYNDPALAYVASTSLPLVKVLLAAGANPNLANPAGETPLDASVTSCRTEAAKLMIAKGGRSHRAASGSSTLNTAVIKGCKAIAALLVKHGADINERDAAPEDRALTSAIVSHNLEMTRWLLANGAKADYPVLGVSLVQLAQVSGNAELVALVQGASR